VAFEYTMFHLRTFTGSFVIAVLFVIFLTGCKGCNSGAGVKEIRGSYPSEDAYFRENISGTGVCDSPGPKGGYLHKRFVIDSHSTESTPAVSNGVVFIPGNMVSLVKTDRYLYAIDEYSGDAKWQFEIDKSDSPKFSDPRIANSPYIVENSVIVGDDGGTVYCIDKANGNLRWKTTVPDIPCTFRATAIAANGKVYIGGGLNFYCLDAANGKVLWTHKIPFGPTDSSAAYCDGVVFFCGSLGTLYALEAATGKEIWNFVEGHGGTHSSPSVSDNTVCISNGNTLYALNAGTGTKKWSYASKDQLVSSAAIWGKKAYILTFSLADGKQNKTATCYCIDLESGNVLWQHKFAETVDVLQMPVISDGILYFGDDSGNVQALDASSGEVIFNEKVENAIWSSITIHDHAMFFATADTTYCIEDYRFNPRVIELSCSYYDVINEREKKKAEIDTMINLLGSGELETRQKAHNELLALGLVAIEQIRANASSEDAQIRYECGNLLLEIPPNDIEGWDFVEKEKLHNSIDYFLCILGSARDIFLAPSIHALERITGEKFAGDLADIKTARVQAYKQYTAWLERNKPSPQENLERYFRFYNHARPHQSLGWRTPAEAYFENQEAAGGPKTAHAAATPVALRAPSVAAADDNIHLNSEQNWS